MVIVVQSFSHVWFFATPWTAAHQASLSFTIIQSLLKFTFTESVMPSNISSSFASVSSCPQSFPASGSFSNESSLCIRWPKHWSFRFSISPSCEYSGLISFGIDWFDLLPFQGILKSLFQYHSSKASILSLLYGPILTSIHDYWKNNSFDYTELCWQSSISSF